MMARAMVVAVDRWRPLTNMTRHVCSAFFTCLHRPTPSVRRYYKNLHFLQYTYIHTNTYTHTYVVPARFIMSIEIANCDFSFRDAKLIRDPDTREICGECTVAFWPLLNQISCRFALQLQLLLLPAACCCPKSASKAFENIHFANNSIAMCKQRGRGGGRDPFASTAICSLATITAKYANKFVTMQQRTCLSGSVYRLSPSARLVAPNNVLQHGAKHRLLSLPPWLLLFSACNSVDYYTLLPERDASLSLSLSCSGPGWLLIEIWFSD